MLAGGKNAVFRLQQGTTNSKVAAFWNSDRKDAIIEYVPSPAVKHGLKKRGHTPDLYHGRGGIEELYKVSKQFIDVEDFHSQTERGVKHEIYGHFLLINLVRLFETDARNQLSCDDPQVQSSGTTLWPQTGKTLKINFKHCLSVVGRHLENLLLMPGRAIADWLDKAMSAAARVRQRNRPGRCYPRRSFKPRTRWNSFDAAPKP